MASRRGFDFPLREKAKSERKIRHVGGSLHGDGPPIRATADRRGYDAGTVVIPPPRFCDSLQIRAECAVDAAS